MRKFTVTLSLALLLGGSVFAAGVPNTINYQGRLTDAAGDAVPDGPILVKFQIYDAATGGAVLWNSLFQTINTVDGLFSYDMGSNVPLPELFGTDSIRYLGITVGTDPELNPRSRFASHGYVFKSQKSDFAYDADSLGGVQPSYYLDWGNMTGVPAGFADGVDDEGIDQVTADGMYVNVNGDIMENTLNMAASGSGAWVARLYGGSVDWGELDLQTESGITGAYIAATNSAGGQLVLRNSSGSQVVSMFGNTIGDMSVSLPNNSINSLEMLDEPGISQNRSTSSRTLNTTNMVDLTQVSITIPSSGYILLNGRTTLRFGGTTGKNWASVQIDETAGGSYDNTYSRRCGMDGYTNTGLHFFNGGVQRTYFKSAGTYTFRLEAIRYPTSTGWADCWYSTLTALFIPTAYGAVTTVAGNPGDHPDAQAVTVTGPDGSTSTAYKMDLRYYEEKARAARIAEQKAELARAEAELELAKARATAEHK